MVHLRHLASVAGAADDLSKVAALAWSPDGCVFVCVTCVLCFIVECTLMRIAEGRAMRPFCVGQTRLTPRAKVHVCDGP
jgi:hypothetical protein